MSTHTRIPPTGAATALACLVVLGAAVVGNAADDAPPGVAKDDPALLAAEKQPLATKSLLLDIADGASRAIAVGERGHVLVSESRGGSDWRQIEGVPTRATLTAVTAVGDDAWAVGHDGIILHSGDGGLTWTRQRMAIYDPQSDDPHNGSPLLDVLFLDAKHGFAIGAYSLLLETTDGGATWNEKPLSAPAAADAAADEVEVEAAEEVAVEGEDGVSDDDWTMSAEEIEIGEESDPHLNGIARTGDGSLFIVAERGSAFRSTDGGQSWQRIKLPYDGSMFGVLAYEDRHVLAFGLRGNVFESTDLGDNWTKIDTGVDLSLMGGAGWEGGGAALVGANGVVLTRSATSASMLKHRHPDNAVLSAAIAPVPGGQLVVAGETGIGTYSPN
jgi:photosystem II stability/assembly factor-like uncharacterized protein